uniref:Uncharacterized protein n=1 Tax=Cannabis sativa TaxID=3483 RepID=A0A803P3M3_CANSA
MGTPTEGVSIPPVKRISVGQDQTKAHAVTFQPKAALETIPENEPTTNRDPLIEVRREKGVKTRLPVQARDESIWEKDQKAKCFRSYGMLLAGWYLFCKINKLEAPSLEEILYFYSVKGNPMRTDMKKLRVLYLQLSFHLLELPPQSIRTEEIVKKEAQYTTFSKEQLKRQPPREVKEAIATNLAVIITNAAKNDNTQNSDWVLCYLDPLFEEEEISERFSTAYLDAGNQGGFDKYFLGINSRRYPMKDYIDRVYQIVRSPRNPGTPLNTIKLDPLMAMSPPNFKEYGNIIGHRGILAFVRRQPCSTSLNGCTRAQSTPCPSHSLTLKHLVGRTTLRSTPTDRCRHTTVDKVPSLGFTFPMRPLVLGHDYLTKVEGVSQSSFPGVVLDLAAVSQNSVPKVGKAFALDVAEMLDNMSLITDSTILWLINEKEREDVTRRVLAIHCDTYLEKFPLSIENDEESNGEVVSSQGLVEAKASSSKAEEELVQDAAGPNPNLPWGPVDDPPHINIVVYSPFQDWKGRRYLVNRKGLWPLLGSPPCIHRPLHTASAPLEFFLLFDRPKELGGVPLASGPFKFEVSSSTLS